MKILITGCSKGFGKSVASFLSKDKCNFIINLGRTKADENIANDNIISDFSDPYCLQKILNNCDHKPELAILNAGQLGSINHCNKITYEELQNSLNVNVISTKVILDYLIKVKTKDVIIISSGAASKPYTGWLEYCVSKASLNMLSSVYACENLFRKIIIVSPGILKTDMNRKIIHSDLKPFPGLSKFETVQAVEPLKVAKFMFSDSNIFDNKSGAFVDLREIDGYPDP